MQQEPEIIQGTIGAIVFQNYDNGYAVLRLVVDKSQTVTVVGTIPMPSVGEKLMVTGFWSTHPSFGRQFEAEFLERMLPETTNEILTYLSSRVIKGIGPKTAARIVNRFGAQTLAIMEQEPQRLAEVSGISSQKAMAIGEAFRLQVGVRRIMEFFALHQLPADLAVRTYKAYGEATIELLYDDPYLLMEDSLEAPFAAVDRFAVEMGIAADDRRRVEAGLIFELKYNLGMGHSFLPRGKLSEATAQLLSIGLQTCEDAIARLLEAGMLNADHLAGISVVYLPELYEAETVSAQLLSQMARFPYETPRGLEKMLRRCAQESDIDYSAQQADAIRQAAQKGLLLITGGPGTGKTTILKGILSLFDQMGLKTQLAAPTGRAAKRISEVTGRDASTIHRLLEATIDPHTGKMFFTRDASSPLGCDAVIVDEMSMVDIQLLYSLLIALRQGTRLIMVGDPDQLPPVGPGFPFNDCLRSRMLPSVRLTEIFRQAQESLIVMNAHRVNQGELPNLRERKKDFFFLPCRSEEETAATIRDLCQRRLPQNMGIPAEQIQVLTPTRKGNVGTWSLNSLLQSALNPGAPEKKERKFGDFSFREGDRVMQIRNNYDIMWKKQDGSAIGAGVFNGDIGILTKIDTGDETLTVVYDDKEVQYNFAQLNELEPAYAMTVHKAQGSEYRAVVMSVWGGSQYLLNRSVLYTAITRAKELLILVGREETVNIMTQNAKVGRRYTGLKLRLENYEI